MEKLVCVLLAVLCSIASLSAQFEPPSLFTNVASANNIWHQDLSPDFGSGVSLVDFNNDGLDDITLLRSGSGVLCFMNTGSGYTNVDLGIELPYDLKQASWVDIDNDGNRDLTVTCYGGPFKVYRNSGGLQFVDVSNETGIVGQDHLTYSQSWADYDRDGDLDLYIGNYNANYWGDPTIENYLYSNNGNFTFTDVTAEAGIGNGSTETLAATWFDHNDDMWPDLMVANDRIQTPNALYLNGGDGTFTDISVATNTHQFFDAMGLAIDDFDNDDQEDIYVTNNWGNRLHKSNNGVYSEANTLFDENVDFLSWGASWIDFDGDGKQDLYVAVDYYVTSQNYNRLYHQEEDGTFNTVPTGGYLLEDQGRCYGTAIGDYNNDGYPDMAVVSAPPFYTKVWQNNTTTNAWLKCTLQGVVSNRDAVGSVIHCYSANHTQRAMVRCGESYLSQNSFTEFFGLGGDEWIDSLIVQWPSGIIDKWYNLPARQSLRLIEGQGVPMAFNVQNPLRLCENSSIEVYVLDDMWANAMWSSGEQGSIQITEPGAYWAMYIDAYGNVFQTDTLHAYLITEPQASWAVNAPLCPDDTPTFIMQNGDSFEWQLNGDMASDSVEIALESETNMLELYDDSGCIFTYMIDVEIPENWQVSATVSPATCHNQCDGTIAISVTGGTGAYEWSVPNPNAIFWCPGSHTIHVTDENGCTHEVTFEIAQPDPIAINPILTLPQCNGEANGVVNFSVSGGVGQYEVWTDFLIGAELSSGTYTVIVEDGLGCIKEQQIFLPEPSPLLAMASVSHDVENAGVGHVAITVEGGTPPFTYWWSNGAGNNATVDGLFAGTYTVQVIDANDCTTQLNIQVESVVGIDEVSASAIVVYPNPAKDRLFWNTSKAIKQVEVYTAQGQRMIHQWTGENVLNCSHWPAGLYVIVFDTDQGQYRTRITVQ